jgi:hypothetical protein
VDHRALKLSPVGVDGLAFVEVAQAARIEEGVYTRGDIESIANRLALNFFGNAMVDGIFAAWLSYSVKQTAGAVAPLLTNDVAKQFLFRKGMEIELKKIWRKSMRHGVAAGMPALKNER